MIFTMMFVTTAILGFVMIHGEITTRRREKAWQELHGAFDAERSHRRALKAKWIDDEAESDWRRRRNEEMDRVRGGSP